jgi:hypothetical protein
MLSVAAESAVARDNCHGGWFVLCMGLNGYCGVVIHGGLGVFCSLSYFSTLI